jgi:hypothetical protein
MARLDDFNRAQTIVLVIALGVALALIGFWFDGRDAVRTGGWFGYAPQTAVMTADRQRFSPLLSTIVWLGLVGVWTVASLRILSSRTSD